MNNSKRHYWLSVIVAVVLAMPAQAAESDADGSLSAVARPRVGLVLGGGGARGAAHIGVLKELERLHVPIDAIAGTSMGAIVGGLYASGMSADELEALVGSLDWAAALSDEASREYLSFRRKQDDREVPIDLEIGLRGTKLVLPTGVIQGQELDLLLRDLTLNVSHISDFDELPIPFRAIASDIVRGEPWVMGKGDLAKSIRASMSVPAVFAPVRIDGRLLVDGGLVGNLPIEVMQAMDVDVIIAVDVEFPLYGPDELDSALTISEQMLTILMRKETVRQIGLLGDRDILIRPELGMFGSTDFDNIVTTIEPGADAAREQADRLATLALDEPAWESYLAARSRPVEAPARLAFVRVLRDGVPASDALKSRLSVSVGDPVDHEVLANNADTLFGMQLYEQVSYRLVETDEGTGVEFLARSKSWGPNVLRFGLSLEDDFEGSSAFNLSVRMTRSGINALGAEWRNDLSVGTHPRLVSEFYQPLNFNSRFFVAPHVSLEQSNLNAFSADRSIARYRLTESEAGIDLGRELGRIGEFRVGLFRGLGKALVRIGDPAISSFDYHTGGAYARLRVDSLDDAFFPRHGILGDVRWTLSRPGLGATSEFDTVEGELGAVFSRGKNTLQVGLDYATTLESDGSVQNYFSLGGFRRLSGLERGEISGPHAAMARLVYYRRVGETTGLLDTPIYLGMTAEAGNVWQDRSDIDFGSTILSGSVFAGFDTLIGPVYVAAGYAEDSRSNFYLFIGAPPR